MKTRCRDCRWVHEADSIKKTSFMGAELCAAHNANLKAVGALLKAAREMHEENMEDEFYSESEMKTHSIEVVTAYHRRDEPKCEYCAAIRRVEKMMKAIKGRKL